MQRESVPMSFNPPLRHRYASIGICGPCGAVGNPIPPTMIHHLHRTCRYWTIDPLCGFLCLKQSVGYLR
jgi:hypothetical protein